MRILGYERRDRLVGQAVETIDDRDKPDPSTTLMYAGQSLRGQHLFHHKSIIGKLMIGASHVWRIYLWN